MEYRTLVVVDGAQNLIECHLNLTNYSMRVGDSNATEKFVDLQLEAHENRRLEGAIQDILKLRRIPLSRESIVTPVAPDSPVTYNGLSNAKHERSKLTVAVNGEDDIRKDTNDGCAYGNGNLTCPRPKKRSQIYCGHHLRLVSHKHQKNRALKRSRSSFDLGNQQDPDYEGL